MAGSPIPQSGSSLREGVGGGRYPGAYGYLHVVFRSQTPADFFFRLTNPANPKPRATRLTGSGTASIRPKSPWVSAASPAVKYKLLVLLPPAPFPNARPQRPSFTIGLPLELDSVPMNPPVVWSNALMVPSPKLPTRISLLSGPKLAGANAIPHGAFNTP